MNLSPDEPTSGHIPPACCCLQTSSHAPRSNVSSSDGLGRGSGGECSSDTTVKRRETLQVVPASPNVPEEADTQGSEVSSKAAAAAAAEAEAATEAATEAAAAAAATTTVVASPQEAAPPASAVRLPPTPALVLPAAHHSWRTAAAVEELSPGTPVTPVTVRAPLQLPVSPSFPPPLCRAGPVEHHLVCSSWGLYYSSSSNMELHHVRTE